MGLESHRTTFSGVDRIRPAYAQVASQLREIILTGDMAAGDRLPNESEMARKFGVSRTTIREAIRVLSSQGLLVTERGVSGGTFVSKADPQHVSDLLEIGLNVMAGSEYLTITELLDTRELIEARAARLAATRRTADDLSLLQTLHDAEDQTEQTFEDLYEAHCRFHLAIAAASQNRLLVVIVGPIFNVLRPFASQVRASPAVVGDDHLSLIVAIRARRAARAEELMLKHLAHLRAAYLSLATTSASEVRNT